MGLELFHLLKQHGMFRCAGAFQLFINHVQLCLQFVYWPPPFQVFKHGAGFVLNGDFLRKITNPRIAGGYGAAV